MSDYVFKKKKTITKKEASTFDPDMLFSEDRNPYFNQPLKETLKEERDESDFERLLRTLGRNF